MGLPELLVIALISFVLIGPERSKDLALKAGRFLRQATTSEWWHEFNQVSKAIKDLPTTLIRMSEIEEAQAEIRRAMTDIEAGTQLSFDEPFPGKFVSGRQTKSSEKQADVKDDLESLADDISAVDSKVGDSAPESDVAPDNIAKEVESPDLEIPQSEPADSQGEAADV
ncbi:MAG: hypothetical protein JXB07_18750 [Anaerolineae bacterium]|nr:hypothetical protein [Anaerolineae bacterium]